MSLAKKTLAARRRPIEDKNSDASSKSGQKNREHQSNGHTFKSKRRRARERNEELGNNDANSAKAVSSSESDNNKAASHYFGDRLSDAWKGKLWGIIKNSKNRQESRWPTKNENRKESKTQGQFAEWQRESFVRKDQHLSSAQRASLNRSMVHRPRKEMLYNCGVIPAGGLLCVLDCDRPSINHDNYGGDESEANDTLSASQIEQSDKTKEVEASIRLSRPIPYLGPGFVPLPKLCVYIACGTNHTLALLQGGTIWVWGKNNYGQLGFPAAKSNEAKQLIHEPRLVRQLQGVECARAACGRGFCVVVTTGGGVYSWGSGASGQLGTGDCPESRYNPVRIQHRRMWVSLQSTARHSKEVPSVHCGDTHTGICTVRGDLWMWGNNEYGQVTGLPPFAERDFDNERKDGDSSDNSLDASDSEGTEPEIGRRKHIRESKECGPKSVQSPMNAMAPRAAASAPSLKKMSTTVLSTMSMGLSLGIGTSSNAKSARKRASDLAKAKKGDSMPLLSLSSGETISKLALGKRHTLILTSHGAVYGWGDTSWGQLGDGFYHKHHHHHHLGHSDHISHHDHHSHHHHKRNNSSYVQATLARRLYCMPQNTTMQDQSTEKSHRTTQSLPKQVIFSRIGAGSAHSVAMTAAGSIWLWGTLCPGRDLDEQDKKVDETYVVEDTARLLQTFIQHKTVRDGEIMCKGNYAFIRTDLGLYAIDEIPIYDGKACEFRSRRASHKLTALKSRRVSIFDGKDIQVQSLTEGPIGPRIYTIIVNEPKSGMQVLNHKTSRTSLVSSAISETCTAATEQVGELIRFEVSLRTHFSVFPTTRRGIIQKANNIALYMRHQPDPTCEATSKSGNDDINIGPVESKENTGDSDTDYKIADSDYYNSSDSNFSSDKASAVYESDDELSEESGELGKDQTGKIQEPDVSWKPWTGLQAVLVGQKGTTSGEVDIKFPLQITSADPSATTPTVIEVVCKSAGRHWLNVTFEGEHVLGSPFEIHAIAAPPVRCVLHSREDMKGHAVVRTGGTNLLSVTAYDKYGNQCSLSQLKTTSNKGDTMTEQTTSMSSYLYSNIGSIDRSSVCLVIDGKEHSSACFDGGTDHTMSLLFTYGALRFPSRKGWSTKKKSINNAPTSKMPKIIVLRVSIGGRLVEGSLSARLLAATQLCNISASVPKMIQVGSALHINIKCDSKFSSSAEEKQNSTNNDTCEEFIVTVVGPKVAGTQSGIGSLMNGRHSRPIPVSDMGNGIYSSIIWPKLPGVHMVAVQHVTHDIVEPSPAENQLLAALMSKKRRGTALAVRIATGISNMSRMRRRDAERKEVRVLRQVQGSPFRVQVDMPTVGTMRRRMVIESHMTELKNLFQRLDIDQDGRVPTSTLESEMRREGSISRLLDESSRNYMLKASTASLTQFVDSLMGATCDEVLREISSDRDMKVEELRPENSQIQTLSDRSVSSVAFSTNTKSQVPPGTHHIQPSAAKSMVQKQSRDAIEHELMFVSPMENSSLIAVEHPKQNVIENHHKTGIYKNGAIMKQNQEEQRERGHLTSLDGPRLDVSQLRSGEHSDNEISMRVVSMQKTDKKSRPKSKSRLNSRLHPRRPKSQNHAHVSPRLSRYGTWSGLSLRHEIRKKFEVLHQSPYSKRITRRRRIGSGSSKSKSGIVLSQRKVQTCIHGDVEDYYRPSSAGSGRLANAPDYVKLRRPQSAQPQSRRRQGQVANNI